MRIQLPGVHVEDERPGMSAIDHAEPADRKSGGIQPEITPPGHGQVHVPDPMYGCREFQNPACTASDLMRKSFGIRDSVTIMANRKNARVNFVSLFDKNVEGPQRHRR